MYLEWNTQRLVWKLHHLYGGAPEEKPQEYTIHFHGDFSLLYDFIEDSEHEMVLGDDLKKKYWKLAKIKFNWQNRHNATFYKDSRNKGMLDAELQKIYKSLLVRHWLLDKYYDENLVLNIHAPDGSIVKPINLTPQELK